MNEIQLQSLPLLLKDYKSLDHIHFSKNNCSVAVHYCIYDKKKKTIINIGTSRPCGNNYNRSSIHAEELAVQYMKNLPKINRYEIYIFRYSKEGFFYDEFTAIENVHQDLKLNYKSGNWGKDIGLAASKDFYLYMKIFLTLIMIFIQLM